MDMGMGMGLGRMCVRVSDQRAKRSSLIQCVDKGVKWWGCNTCYHSRAILGPHRQYVVAFLSMYLLKYIITLT